MRRLNTAALAVVVLAALAGCVTPDARQAGPSAKDDPTIPCMNAMRTDPRFAALGAKIAITLPPEQAPLEMLGDRTYASATDRAALSAWNAERNTCFQAGQWFRDQYAPPAYRAFISGNQTRIAALTSRLHSGEITFGEFNRLRAEGAAASAQTIAREQQREQERSAALATEEDDRRRAAVGQAIQTIQNQQLLNQQQMNANRIRQTNCQRFGNQVTCTTY